MRAVLLVTCLGWSRAQARYRGLLRKISSYAASQQSYHNYQRDDPLTFYRVLSITQHRIIIIWRPLSGPSRLCLAPQVLHLVPLVPMALRTAFPTPLRSEAGRRLLIIRYVMFLYSTTVRKGHFVIHHYGCSFCSPSLMRPWFDHFGHSARFIPSAFDLSSLVFCASFGRSWENSSCPFIHF